MIAILLLQLLCAIALIVFGIANGNLLLALIGLAYGVLAALEKWVNYKRKRK